MTEKFISDNSERQYLISASAVDVLKYLDALVDGIKKSCPLPDDTVQKLLDRNDRIVDLGLAAIVDEEGVLETILNRRTDDEDVLTASLSNRLAHGILQPSSWLSQRLSKIVHEGTNEQLKVLFENESLHDDIIRTALQRRGHFESVSTERYYRILWHLLRNKNISRELGDSSDYYCARSPIIEATWGLLLSLEPTNDNAVLLHDNIENFPELRIPKGFSIDLQIDEQKSSRERSLEEYKAFLTRVFEKWVSPHGEGSDFDLWGHIRKITIAKLPSYYLFDLEDVILGSKNSYQVQGFFSLAAEYEISGRFDEFFATYGRDFVMGLFQNKDTYLKSNRLSRKVYELRGEFDESNRGYGYTLDFAFQCQVERLAKHPYSQYYISTPSDFYQEEPEAKEESLFYLNEKVKRIQGEMKTRPDGPGSVNQQLNSLSDLFAVLSKKIDFMGTKTEELTKLFGRQTEELQKLQAVLAEKIAIPPWGYVVIAFCAGYWLSRGVNIFHAP